MVVCVSFTWEHGEDTGSAQADGVPGELPRVIVHSVTHTALH